MKKSLFFAPLLTAILAASAQKQVLFVGNSSSMTIKSGTIFSADSLALTPVADFTLSSNTIQESSSPVGFAPAAGINRQYDFGSQITFTGTIQLYYQLSELNGDAESSLEYADSTNVLGWVPELASTVNTSL